MVKMKRSVLTTENLSEVAKELIIESGMTHEQIAKRAGIAEQTVGLWRTGKTNPRTEHFLWFLESLGYRLIIERKE
jgi:transcriptional regulator with XRE-family HTH domain